MYCLCVVLPLALHLCMPNGVCCWGYVSRDGTYASGDLHLQISAHHFVNACVPVRQLANEHENNLRALLRWSHQFIPHPFHSPNCRKKTALTREVSVKKRLLAGKEMPVEANCLFQKQMWDRNVPTGENKSSRSPIVTLSVNIQNYLKCRKCRPLRKSIKETKLTRKSCGHNWFLSRVLGVRTAIRCDNSMNQFCERAESCMWLFRKLSAH
jgi:hypothetical protein